MAVQIQRAHGLAGLARRHGQNETGEIVEPVPPPRQGVAERGDVVLPAPEPQQVVEQRQGENRRQHRRTDSSQRRQHGGAVGEQDKAQIQQRGQADAQGQGAAMMRGHEQFHAVPPPTSLRCAP